MHPCSRALCQGEDFHLALFPVAIGIARIDRPAAYAKDVLYKGPRLERLSCLYDRAGPPHGYDEHSIKDRQAVSRACCFL